MERTINETKADAEKILAEMNEMIRGKPFGKVIGEDVFLELNERIHELGWLALIDAEKSKGMTGVELKLVDPDSDEARLQP